MRRPALPVPLLLALVLSVLTLASFWAGPRVFAALSAVGPVNPATGFPLWYRDSNGVALQMCLDNPRCLSTAAALVPPDGEAFWWSGEAAMGPAPGVSHLLVLALEAAFLGGPGSEISFGRVRIRSNGLVPGQDYVYTHPYGVDTLTANALGQVRFSEDIGCEVTPCDFTAAFGSRVDPFLTAVSPPPPAGFLGDPLIDQTVTGSPFGTNFFRVAGSNAGGPGVNLVETPNFAIEGMLTIAAVNDTATVPAGAGPVPINVLANDIAPTPLVVSAVGPPANGASAIATLGTASWVTYDNNGTAGADSFTYTASDVGGNITGTATVNVTAHAGNLNPVAANDAFTVTVNSVGNILNVLSATIGLADSDLDGDVIFVSGFPTLPANGTVSIGAAGRNVVFNAGATPGASTFTYTLSDGLGSSTGTVTVTVNTPPVAVNDAFTVTANTLNNPLDVLLNDVEPDVGQVKRVSAVGTPTNGTAGPGPGGANVLFNPPANFGGTSVFTYTVTDGAASATGTVNVTVNRFPTATADSIPVPINSQNNALNVLANDGDPDGNAVMVTAIGTPAKGTASIGTGGATIVYTPTAGLFGTDPFSYTISDGPAGGPGVLSATTTVTVTIDRAPTAVGDSARAPQNSTNNAINVLANDSDPDGDALTVTAVTQPASGTTAVGTGGANVIYTPSTGFVGVETFTYTMRGVLITSTATVTMTVHRGPVGVNDSFKVAMDSSGNVLNVLANDFDPDGDAILVSAVTQGSSGIVSVGAGGANVAYTPNLGFAGVDSFTYTVSDGQTTATGTVLVTVNRAPAAAADLVTVQRNTTANPINVLANDSDPDGNSITVSAVAQPTNGTAAIGPAGLTALYTPNPGFTGPDSFTYTISDGHLTASASVGVVIPDQRTTNFAPVAAADSATVARNSSNNPINVLANDTDPDGDSLRVISVGTAGSGLAVVGTAGAVVFYTPNRGFTGNDSFSYVISDGILSASAVANITVAENAPPVANIDNFTVPRNSTNNRLPVLANDTDPEGDPLFVTAAGTAANGTAALGPGATTGSGSTTIVYTPNPVFGGTDTFSYSITDGVHGSSATVNITVHPLNNAPVALSDSVAVPVDSGSNFLGVLANDSDPDGDPVAVASVTQGANGAVAISADRGRVLYTPNARFSGTDTFTYRVIDGLDTSSNAIVTVRVQGTRILMPILTQGAIPGW